MRFFLSLFSPLFLVIPLSAQSTERVSVDSGGVEGDSDSFGSAFSADARFVAFSSHATNLVPGDTGWNMDVFVHNRQTGQTTRVSVDSASVQGNDDSWTSSLSADGRFAAFSSRASNLVPGDTNSSADTFVHDRQTGQTSRVSVDSAGNQGNAGGVLPSLSADGRYVAFWSQSSNLVANDTNGWADVFVHDRQTGETTLVSIGAAGVQGNNDSGVAFVSADGRFVVFTSWANNLVPGDLNAARDVFVRDRQMDQTSLVSVDSLGVQGNGTSLIPSISADGHFVAFDSYASNLVPGDTNGALDVFVHDRQTGLTTLISVDSMGGQGDSDSSFPSISADGRFVSFQSEASNLVPGDTNGMKDVFVHDRQTGITTRVSVDSAGVQGIWDSLSPSISADGRFVAFESLAFNLVPGDTNGAKDVFVHDAVTAADKNTIILAGPYLSPVGGSVDLSWFAAPPNSRYWLAYSLNLNGSVVAGHPFDLGQPATVRATGAHSSAGTGTYSSPPVPPGAAGLTVFLEIAAEDAGGLLYDSVPLATTFY